MGQAEVVAIVTGLIEFSDEDDSVREQDLNEIELKKKEIAKRAALAKFNWFLHFTAYISGGAYMVILGVLYPKALPFVLIPLGLWTVGIFYHFYRAFFNRENPKRNNNVT